jgi:hypothetical protein
MKIREERLFVGKYFVCQMSNLGFVAFHVDSETATLHGRTFSRDLKYLIGCVRYLTRFDPLLMGIGTNESVNRSLQSRDHIGGLDGGTGGCFYENDGRLKFVMLGTHDSGSHRRSLVEAAMLPSGRSHPRSQSVLSSTFSHVADEWTIERDGLQLISSIRVERVKQRNRPRHHRGESLAR